MQRPLVASNARLSQLPLRQNLGSREGVIVHETLFEPEADRVSSRNTGGVLWITWRAHRLSPQSCQRRKNLATALDGAHLRPVVLPESHGLARVSAGADRAAMDDDASGDGLPDLLPHAPGRQARDLAAGTTTTGPGVEDLTWRAAGQHVAVFQSQRPACDVYRRCLARKHWPHRGRPPAD